MSASAARTLKCPNCGAPAVSGASQCTYCRSRLATVGCPSCFAQIFEGSAYCAACGAARSRAETGKAHQFRCPACKGEMTWVTVGDADLLECARCEGTWLEAATFERICADRESQGALLHPSRQPPARPKTRVAPVRYRPCPQCKKLMNRVNFGRTSGAVVDVCKGHGTFLDRGELHQIVRFIRNGGIDRARAAERERLGEERRRLQDLERMHARLFPGDSRVAGYETSISRLLGALFGSR